MTEIIQSLPLILMGVMALGNLALAFRLTGALDKALERQQGSQPVIPPDVAVPAGPVHPSTGSTPVDDVRVAPAKAVSTDPIVTEGLVSYVKNIEGFSAKAYPDNAQWSIGYGTRTTNHEEIIDKAEAERRLRVELADAAKFVQSFIPNAPIGVRQGMSDATYNLGPGWHTAGLGALLVNGQYDEAKTRLMQYDHEHKDGVLVENEGLKKRRADECGMFDHPV